MQAILALCMALVTDACPVIEPPQLWSAIANNTALDDTARRMAVIHLINRHASPGMPLTEFRRLLDKPNWLQNTFINWNNCVLCGFIPCEIRSDTCTTFGFGMFPGASGDPGCVYFRVSGKMDEESIYAILKGELADHAEATVLEIATIRSGRDSLFLKWKREEKNTCSTVTATDR